VIDLFYFPGAAFIGGKAVPARADEAVLFTPVG
jgi:hypothetical protein